MNQENAKELYQEAGRLFAEQRLDDALQLFEELVEAFPTNADIALSHAKCLAELGHIEEATNAATFVRDTLSDPRGDELLETLPLIVPEPDEFFAPVDELEPRYSRFMVAGLVGLSALGAVGFYFVQSENAQSSAATESTPDARIATVPENVGTPERTTVPSTNQRPAEVPAPEPTPPAPQGQDQPSSSQSESIVPTIVENDAVAVTAAMPADNEVIPPRPNESDATEPAEDSLGEVLIHIVRANDIDAAVELLRDHRELSNALDFENRPVLTYAQSVAMAELLIEAGADYDVSTVNGWTPLMWIAGRNGNIDVARYLIERGAWVSIEDDNGMRPIHQAAFMGNHDLVAAFVSSGADINAIDDTNVTPLHGAAWSGDLEGVTLYLALGADPTLQNKRGETPYDTANARGHEELLALLDPAGPAEAEPESLMPASAPTSVAGTRELQFPDDIRLGTVQIRDWGSTDYKAWEPVGSAWGTVTVPIGKEVMLMVDVPRLEGLQAIEAEGIQVLYLRDLSLDDDQLTHLYHLKGLRKLTLSNTGVSKAAIDALREALPECTMRD